MLAAVPNSALVIVKEMFQKVRMTARASTCSDSSLFVHVFPTAIFTATYKIIPFLREVNIDFALPSWRLEGGPGCCMTGFIDV